ILIPILALAVIALAFIMIVGAMPGDPNNRRRARSGSGWSSGSSWWTGSSDGFSGGGFGGGGFSGGGGSFGGGGSSGRWCGRRDDLAGRQRAHRHCHPHGGSKHLG